MDKKTPPIATATAIAAATMGRLTPELAEAAKADASRETSVHGVGTLRIRVTLPAGRGVLRVGNCAAGQTIERSADDAIRLVDHKGFQYATPADAQLAAEHVQQRNAAATAHAEVAAAADGEGGGTPNPSNQE